MSCDSSLPLSPAAEGAAIAAVWEHTLIPGAKWHVLPAKFFDSWCAYTGFSCDAGTINAASSGPRPPPLDLSSLLHEASTNEVPVLKKDILEGNDYTLVEGRAAELLERWYQLPSAPLVREVITSGVRKRTRVDLFPAVLRIITCDSNGQPTEKSEIKTFPASTVFSDVQELYHNAVVEREEQKQADSFMTDVSEPQSSIPEETKEPEQEPRVRLWLKKPPSSTSSEPSTALVVASGVTDLTTSSSSSSSSATYSSAYEREWKQSSTVAPPDDEEAQANKLDPEAPTVRTTRLPPPQVSSDEWKLLSEDELLTKIETFQLPPFAEVLLETREIKLLKDEEGVDSLEQVWPREAYHYIKKANHFDVGDEVDCKDTLDTWIEAKILASCEEPFPSFFVKYVGFIEKWNEWVRKDAGRIAPLHAHTIDKYATSSSSSSSNFRSSYSMWGSSQEGKPEITGAVGLSNLGNTCFMNSTLQCLSHCVPLTDYFLDDLYKSDLNLNNPLGWSGRVANEYASLLKDMWSDKYRVVSPKSFKDTISEFQPRFEGYAQHDSSELLAFLLDGLHEDLNRVLKKPATNAVESNNRPDAVVAAEAWDVYLMRNKSVIVDSLQGQLKSTLVCPIETCKKVSITFDPFMFLSVPLPTANDTLVSLHIVYSDPSRPIVQVGAVVAKNARLFDLKAAVCATLGDIPNPRRLVFADIFQSRVYRFFEEEGQVSDIKANDVVYAFECPEIDDYTARDSEAGGFYPVSILFHKREPNPYYGSKYSIRHAEKYQYGPHALPRVMCFPRKQELTVRTILDRIRNKVTPHLRSSVPVAENDAGEGEPNAALVPPPVFTQTEIDSAFQVIVADEKGENCGVHENNGWTTDKCYGCVLREFSQRKEKDAAEEAAAKRKIAAMPKQTGSGKITSHMNTYEAFLAASDGVDSDDSDDEDMEKGKAEKEEVKSEGEGSGVIVNGENISPASSTDNEAVMVDVVTSSPSIESQAAAATTTTQESPASSVNMGDAVKVEISDASATNASTNADAAMSDAATVSDAPITIEQFAENLDVPFKLNASPAYTFSSEMIARCSFVVRLESVHPPPPNQAVLTETSAASSSSPEASPSPISGISSDDSPAPPSASPAPIAIPYFDKESFDKTVKHSSLQSVAKENVDGIMLQDCIKAFTKEETLSLEDPWYCNQCKEHRQATKKFDLWKLPEVLIIHLKRFSYSRYSRDKLTTFVNFPIVGLDMSEFTVNPAHAGEMYDLFAVSNHYGGLGGGHYTAYAQNHSNGLWYLHDDSSVSRVRSISDIRSVSAYVLFYRRRPKGATVPTEAEIQASMDQTTNSERVSTYPPSSSSMTSQALALDLD